MKVLAYDVLGLFVTQFLSKLMKKTNLISSFFKKHDNKSMICSLEAQNS